MSRKIAKFNNLALADQVRKLHPVAVEIVQRGLDLDQARFAQDGRSPVGYLEEFIGHDGPCVEDDEDTEMVKTEEVAAAAYALGIAVGQLLHPTTFGGAR